MTASSFSPTTDEPLYSRSATRFRASSIVRASQEFGRSEVRWDYPILHLGLEVEPATCMDNGYHSFSNTKVEKCQLKYMLHDRRKAYFFAQDPVGNKSKKSGPLRSGAFS